MHNYYYPNNALSQSEHNARVNQFLAQRCGAKRRYAVGIACKFECNASHMKRVFNFCKNIILCYKRPCPIQRGALFQLHRFIIILFCIVQTE